MRVDFRRPWPDIEVDGIEIAGFGKFAVELACQFRIEVADYGLASGIGDPCYFDVGVRLEIPDQPDEVGYFGRKTGFDHTEEVWLVNMSLKMMSVAPMLRAIYPAAAFPAASRAS